ncbi:flagellar motor switch protein G [Vibrio cholerae]|nr:flagellar motor switch protein G [Vibrio cholerae]
MLLSLNEEDAAGIIRHLEPKQVQRVGSAMARGRYSKIHQHWYGQ